MLVPGASGEKTQLLDGAQVDHLSEQTVGHGVRVRGISNGDTPAAGDVGQSISQSLVRTSAVALVSGTPKTVTSYQPTAGVYLVSGYIGIVVNATTVNYCQGGIHTVTDALPDADSGWQTTSNTFSTMPVDITLIITPQVISTNGSTVYYLVTRSGFSGGTANTSYGKLNFVRIA